MGLACRRIWCGAAIAALALCGFAPAQDTAGKCKAEGSVVNSLTGQPVRKARVMFAGPDGGEGVSATTDSQGKYAVAGLAPGVYSVSANHQGFQTQSYGAKKPGEQKGTPLELTAGSTRTKVDLSLTPLAVIVGHVRDEDGDPMRDVQIALMTYRYGPSGRKLLAQNGAQSDPTGEFRLFDIEPGQYYLRATPPSAQVSTVAEETGAYATVFYPGATEAAAAAPVTIAAGQELRGLDFALRPASTANIRGRVIKPEGSGSCAVDLEEQPDTGVMSDVGGVTGGVVINLAGAMDGNLVAMGDDGENTGRRVKPDGRFEFRTIPSGSHILVARCQVDKQTYRARLQVELSRADLENVELRPVAPSNITGHVRIEGESKHSVNEARVMVVLGFDFVNPNGAVNENGEFAFHELGPNSYRLHVEAPEDLYVKSVEWGGRDVSDSGIDLSAGGATANVDVLLSANGGAIEGSVENGAGATITLIPADPHRAASTARTAQADRDGHFNFAGVPPGRYHLFAWEHVEVEAVLYDAEFRKPYESKAQTLEITEKQKATAQLQLIPAVEK